MSGYAVVGPVFTPDEMRFTADALTSPDIHRTKAGARHWLVVPEVRALADDARALAIATRLLGATPIPFRATLFDKSPDANWLVAWHQDTALPLLERIVDAEWGPWSVKGGVLHIEYAAAELSRRVPLAAI